MAAIALTLFAPLDTTSVSHRHSATHCSNGMGRRMGMARAPRSLRSTAARQAFVGNFDGAAGKTVSTVASLIAVASVSSGAHAQQTNLPPVNVDAPKERPRSTAAKPTPDQVRARNALRRAAQRQQAVLPTAIPTRIQPRPTRSITCRPPGNSRRSWSTRRDP